MFFFILADVLWAICCLVCLTSVHQDSSSHAGAAVRPARLLLLRVQRQQRSTSGQLRLHSAICVQVFELHVVSTLPPWCISTSHNSIILNCITIVKNPYFIVWCWSCVFVCFNLHAVVSLAAGWDSQWGSPVITSVFLDCPSYSWDLLGSQYSMGYFLFCLPLPVGSLRSELWILSTSRRLEAKGRHEAACGGGETRGRGERSHCASASVCVCFFCFFFC